MAPSGWQAQPGAPYAIKATNQTAPLAMQQAPGPSYRTGLTGAGIGPYARPPALTSARTGQGLHIPDSAPPATGVFPPPGTDNWTPNANGQWMYESGRGGPAPATSPMNAPRDLQPG